MKETRFFWVRHAPTHVTGLNGWTDSDVDLSDGFALQRLSTYLPREAVVVTSDLSRAILTGNAIAGMRKRIAPKRELREINFGAWEGKTHQEVSESDPVLAREFFETPGHITPPEGESWMDMSTRVNGMAAQLAMMHPGQNVIVVAHFGAILAHVQLVHQIPPAQIFSHRIDPLSVSETSWAVGWKGGKINHKL